MYSEDFTELMLRSLGTIIGNRSRDEYESSDGEKSSNVVNLSADVLLEKLSSLKPEKKVERLSLLLLLTDLVDKEKINEYQQQIEQIMSDIYKKDTLLFQKLVEKIDCCVNKDNIFFNIKQYYEILEYFSYKTLKFQEIQEYQTYIKNKKGLEAKLNRLENERKIINISLGKLQAEFDSKDKTKLKTSSQEIPTTENLDKSIEEIQSLLEISNCKLLQKRSKYEENKRSIEQKYQEKKIKLEKIKFDAEEKLKPYIKEAKDTQIRGGLFAIISIKPLKMGLIQAYRDYMNPAHNEEILKLNEEIHGLESENKKLETDFKTIQETKKQEEEQKNDLEKQKADRLFKEKELKELNDLQQKIEGLQQEHLDKEKEISEVDIELKTLSKSFNDRLREIRKVDKEYLKLNVTLVGNREMSLEEYIQKCRENEKKIEGLQRR